MKIFNSYTNKKEEFKPMEPGKVGMYVCGPTVYNYVHIGNTRPMIVFDVLRRVLEYQGYDQMMPNMPMQYQNMSQNASFYAGNMPGLMPANNEYSERLAKVERQISRLEHRISKLENNGNISSTDDYESTTNNMYII